MFITPKGVNPPPKAEVSVFVPMFLLGTSPDNTVPVNSGPALGKRDGTKVVCRTRKVVAMRLIRTLKETKAQSLIEYAMVAAIVSAALIAMSTYVFRSVQSTQQMIQKEFRNQ